MTDATVVVVKDNRRCCRRCGLSESCRMFLFWLLVRKHVAVLHTFCSSGYVLAVERWGEAEGVGDGRRWHLVW